MAKKSTSKKKTGNTALPLKQVFRQLMNDQEYYLRLNATKRNYFRQLRARFKSNALRPETMKTILTKHGYALTQNKLFRRKRRK